MTYLSITPDQLASAGSYISHTWGDYGYRIEKIETPYPQTAVSLFHVVASDGSRFIVAADRWGNCRYTDSHGYETPERTAALDALVREMHANATAV